MTALLALAAGLGLAGWETAAAQDAGAAATAPAVEEPAAAITATVAADAAAADAAAPVAAGAVSANAVNDVARELWCPLCSGVRLDACELKACAQMKDVISEKLASGEDTASIKNYFVAQYGPQVLGEPPLEGFNWLAWILPVVAMIAGGLLVWTRVRNSTRQAQHARTEAAAPAAGDAYSRQLDEELKHYE